MQKHFFLYEESQKKKFQTDQRIFWHWSLKGEAHSWKNISKHIFKKYILLNIVNYFTHSLQLTSYKNIINICFNDKNRRRRPGKLKNKNMTMHLFFKNITYAHTASIWGFWKVKRCNCAHHICKRSAFYIIHLTLYFEQISNPNMAKKTASSLWY